jgi:hypothetical protein
MPSGAAADIRALTAVIVENPEGHLGVDPDPDTTATRQNSGL